MSDLLGLVVQQWMMFGALGVAILVITAAVIFWLPPFISTPRAGSSHLDAQREALFLIHAGEAEALNPIALSWAGDSVLLAAGLAGALGITDVAGFDTYLRDCIDPAREASRSMCFETTDNRCLDVVAQPDGWQARLSIVDVTDIANRAQLGEAAARRADLAADRMRYLAERAPLLQWRSDVGGRLLWSNVDLFERYQWPRQSLEAVMASPVEVEHGQAVHVARKRICVPDDDHPDGQIWFEVTRIPHADGTVLNYAASVQNVVDAENSLSRFVETLTETFAHLPTGLAIFDRNRELGLFNPALSNLLGLDPAWMAGRPNLAVVLNALRERRAIPDQRDFISWREGLLGVGAPGQPDRYEEEWVQPSGRTLRVVARPHPHGALALLVVDITTDLALERQFCARTDMRDAVLELDQVPRVIVDMDGAVRYVSPEVERFAKSVFNADFPPQFAAFMEHFQKSLTDDEGGDIARISRFVSRAGEVASVLVVPVRPDLAFKLEKVRGGSTLVTFRGPLAENTQNISAAGPGRVPRDVLDHNDHLLDRIVTAPPDVSSDFEQVPCDRPDLLRRVLFNMLLSVSELGRDGGSLYFHADASDGVVTLSAQLTMIGGVPDDLEPAGLLPMILLRRYLEAEGGQLEVMSGEAVCLRAVLPVTAFQLDGCVILPKISAQAG